MKTILFILTTLLITSSALAQPVNGVITYNRKADWVSIFNKMPWMTQEDINRMTLNFSKRDKGDGINYDLHFNTFESIYQQKKEEESDGATQLQKR